MAAVNKEVWAYLGLSVSTIIIGLSFIITKIALESSNPLDLLAHRFTAAAVAIIFPLAFGFIKLPKMTWRKVFKLLSFSVFYPLLFFGFQTFGLQYSSASEGGIIFATTPVITLIAASFFLKEKTNIIEKIGIILSVFGIFYILYGKGLNVDFSNIAGIVLLLLSVLSLVAYFVLVRKANAEFDALVITLFMTFLAFIAFNTFSLLSHFQNGTISDFLTPLSEPSFVWSVLYLGILSTVVTSFFSNYALSVIPASTVSIFGNLSPIIAVIGGVLILNETLYFYHIVGGLLVLSGIAGSIAFKSKQKEKIKCQVNI